VEKQEALDKLKVLVESRKDLHLVAKENDITVKTEKGTINKGWAGQAVERYLGLQINSARSPNLGSWELKTVPLTRLKDNELKIKETMAITMIDPPHILFSSFEKSHLFTKLQRLILIMRSVGKNALEPTYLESVHASILDEGDVYQQVKEDYDLVRSTLKEEGGFEKLTGKMGVYIQPRTKGQGGESPKTRAFYARPNFIKKITDEDGYNYLTHKPRRK
jgi:DNA mismatch repair protein MutH